MPPEQQPILETYGLVPSNPVQFQLERKMRFCDAEPANFVLQSGALQAESLGSSAASGDPSRGGSQGVNDYVTFCLPKTGG